MNGIDICQDADKLQKLGLSPLQAKIFLILVHAGKEKTLAIAKNAKIDRSNTYRIILQLQNMGLITKLLGQPSFYEAIPLEEAILTLLNRKRCELERTEKLAKELIQRHRLNNKSITTEHQFTIGKWPKEKLIREITIDAKTAKNTVDLILNKNTFYVGFIELANEQIACLKRGVKYRVITERISAEIIKRLACYQCFSNLKIKCYAPPPKAELVIIDKETVTVSLNANASVGENEWFFSNHPPCIEMFQSHFDKIWKRAQFIALHQTNPVKIQRRS